MLELLLKEPGQLQLQSASPPEQPLAANELRIRLLYGGICGSDLKVYQGQLSYAAYPLRPGHELLGRVVAAGAHTHLPVGTRVVVNPNTYCGE
ncbi:MAG: alcohol dehydrogenase catalytic domain-containing protein, partial [Alicyclobacillus sp.]|nr:alcohol dehydrogenase catalytic domain-containing protein [Alicyclobacillus sp.]